MGSGRAGRIGAGTVVLLLLAALLLHLAIQTVPPYVDYLYIKDGVQVAVRLATAPPHNEGNLRRQIEEKLKEREVKLPEQQFVTSIDGQRAYARLNWAVPIRVLWYTHVMQFTVEHAEPLR
ncbi:MAG: hypothetical protein HYY54_07990 [candidate division NC10 bacterium]|nr:hypothetical protein [candidate division NC10 bacterium]MBI3003537.1 hypothetical protein [candidate division NC10 bacterium]MBI4392023.1 hypothetical protein [candidate division NC10 bacterium]